jgi:hypothetical protein
MSAVVDLGLVASGIGLAELARWVRARRYLLRMTVEALEDTEAEAVDTIAARSRRAQEQMRRVAFHHRGQR